MKWPKPYESSMGSKSERRQKPKKTTDEEFVKELLALRYDGELSAEEMKQMLRDSHRFGERNIKHSASFA